VSTFRTVFVIAYRNLVQAKRRTLLLGLAVSIVALLFLLLRSLSASVSERMIESATTLSAGHVNVSGFFKTRTKAADPLVIERARLKTFVKSRVKGLTTVIDRHRGWGRVISPTSSLNSGMSGIIYEDEARFFSSLRLAPEREYRTGGGDAAKGSFEDMKQPNTVLIFSAQAKKLEVGVGDTITVVIEGSGRGSNTVDLRVAAIASDIGFLSNWNIYVPRQVILDLYKYDPDTTGIVMMYLDNPARAEAVMAQLKTELKAEGFALMEHDPRPFFFKFEKVAGEDWLGQQIDLTIWSDEISFILWVTTALDLVSFFVVGVLALIIIGGIANAMWMSVRERTKEIGTMRAIGAQKGFVLRVFLTEAVLLGLFASAFGIVIAWVGLAIVSSLQLPIANEGIRLFLMANTFDVRVHPIHALATLLLFALITGVAALWPAFKASRLRPVEALMQGK